MIYIFLFGNAKNRINVTRVYSGISFSVFGRKASNTNFRNKRNFMYHCRMTESRFSRPAKETFTKANA